MHTSVSAIGMLTPTEKLYHATITNTLFQKHIICNTVCLHLKAIKDFSGTVSKF